MEHLTKKSSMVSVAVVTLMMAMALLLLAPTAAHAGQEASTGNPSVDCPSSSPPGGWSSYGYGSGPGSSGPGGSKSAAASSGGYAAVVGDASFESYDSDTNTYSIIGTAIRQEISDDGTITTREGTAPDTLGRYVRVVTTTKGDNVTRTVSVINAAGAVESSTTTSGNLSSGFNVDAPAFSSDVYEGNIVSARDVYATMVNGGVASLGTNDMDDLPLGILFNLDESILDEVLNEDYGVGGVKRPTHGRRTVGKEEGGVIAWDAGLNVRIESFPQTVDPVTGATRYRTVATNMYPVGPDGGSWTLDGVVESLPDAEGVTGTFRGTFEHDLGTIPSQAKTVTIAGDTFDVVDGKAFVDGEWVGITESKGKENYLVAVTMTQREKGSELVDGWSGKFLNTSTAEFDMISVTITDRDVTNENAPITFTETVEHYDSKGRLTSSQTSTVISDNNWDGGPRTDLVGIGRFTVKTVSTTYGKPGEKSRTTKTSETYYLAVPADYDTNFYSRISVFSAPAGQSTIGQSGTSAAPSGDAANKVQLTWLATTGHWSIPGGGPYSDPMQNKQYMEKHAKWIVDRCAVDVAIDPWGGTATVNDDSIAQRGQSFTGAFVPKRATGRSQLLLQSSNDYSALGITFVRPGYDFDGLWAHEDDGFVQVYAPAAGGTCAAKNGTGYWVGGCWQKDRPVILWAHWRPKTVALTIDPNQGRMTVSAAAGMGWSGNASRTARKVLPAKDKTTLTSGTSSYAMLPFVELSRDGYVFNGLWDAREGGRQVYDARLCCVNDGTYWSDNAFTWHGGSSLTLYAHWAKFIENPATSMRLLVDTSATPRTLTVGIADGDEGITSVSGGGTYFAGYNAKLTAKLKPGYAFVGWIWKNSEGTVLNSDSASGATFVMADRDATVVAKSRPTIHSLTISGSDNKGIKSITGAGSYAEGAKAKLSVTLNPGYAFDGWTSVNANGKLANASSQKGATYTMGRSDAVIAVHVQRVGYTLTVEAAKGDDGVKTVKGGGVYARRKTVKLSVTLKPGYAFAGWTVQNAGGGWLTGANSQTGATFTMGADDAVVTVRTTRLYALTVKAAAGDKGIKSVSGGGKYTSGATAKLSATLKPGYAFAGWSRQSGAGKVANATSQQDATFAMGASDAIVIAASKLIVKRSVSVVGDAGVLSTSGGGSYGEGTTAKVGATAKPGYHLTGWVVDGAPVACATYGATSETRSYTVGSHDGTLKVTSAGNTYGITFCRNAPKGASKASVEQYTQGGLTYGSAAKLSKLQFAVTGYTFVGWSTSSGGPVSFNDAASVSTFANPPAQGGTVALYAQWAKSGGSHTLTVRGGAGVKVGLSSSAKNASSSASTSVQVGKQACLYAFVESGYEFAGWTVTGATADGATSRCAKVVMGASNVTAVATAVKKGGATQGTSPAGGDQGTQATASDASATKKGASYRIHYMRKQLGKNLYVEESSAQGSGVLTWQRMQALKTASSKGYANYHFAAWAASGSEAAKSHKSSAVGTPHTTGDFWPPEVSGSHLYLYYDLDRYQVRIESTYRNSYKSAKVTAPKAAGGTMSASASTQNGPLTALPEAVEVGAKVSLTATPCAGRVVSWQLRTAGVAAPKVSKTNTFTMPAATVTISSPV